MTAALGWRPWAGGELYVNPEVVQLSPFSSAIGLGAYPNGEILRNTANKAKFYVPRLYARHTWNLGNDREEVESDFNQLAGTISRRRIVMTLGRMSVDDLFDDNNYSHDPRSQFMNWSIMSAGSFDFVADERGSATGAAIEGWWDDWALRFARFALPSTLERPQANRGPFRKFGDQVEFERAYTIGERAGKVRFLLFRDRATLATFADALKAPGIPNLDVVRGSTQDKRGWGLNIEQQMSQHLGLFGRFNAADGRSEVLSYAEIDRSASAGVLVDGAAWKRKGDTFGVALARNELSDVHRQYLARGGMGLLIGDGRLNYQPEIVLEAFYARQLGKWLTISFDWQRINHPGYNADRGPVNVSSLRMHAEF
jgi:hypothetical protein